MKSLADRHRLYQEYICHYESRSHDGNVTLCDPQLQCRGDTQRCRGDTHLCDSPAALGETYSQLIRQNLQSKKLEHKVEALKQMMKGFAVLELICVNLFLFPWRKEIRTLKKFTGTFVYFIQPVIPEDAIRQILQRVGYSIVSNTEYTIGGKINSEEAKQTAFDMYLSRIQCENLLWRLNEDKSVSVSLLVHGPGGHEVKNGSDLTDQTGKNPSGTDEIQNLDLKSNDPSIDDPIKAADLTVTRTSSQDDISDLSKQKPRYCTKRMDSDEFLYKYSDLNFAQQPIFPLHIKPKKWVTPVSEEPNFAKPDIPDGPTKNEGRDLAEKITYDLQGDNIDIQTFTEQLDPPKSLVSNESPAEVIVPTKQERVVSKLKMLNMSGESLTYPIEETVPPDSAKFSESKIEVKWAFLNTKEGTESLANPMPLSSDFSMLNISGKPPIWTPGTDNRLREPPNSTYIPPRAPENERMRSPNIKVEEDHFQVSSPSGDALLVNEFNIHDDTKEDYVMITKKDHIQN
ncbi:uncharacterized protein [Phyllobates terribilis]|uniref:uncharacterized protein n=1 Tax=Phyllobates terribilis TaxID=111132 RepID=UPI003CCB6215